MEQLNSHGQGDLGVFPEELWLLVLDKLVHSEDILNVLRAFPALDKSVQNKKPYWLFDQVLPHLMTKHLVIKKNNRWEDHTESQELLKLRLVSKRWKGIVDSSIQTHGDRHPINSESGKRLSNADAALVLPVNHFNYNRINKYHLGATLFRTTEQIDEFLREMDNFEGNPFPGKHVHFETASEDSNFHEYIQEFVKKAMQLLEKFGEHVLVLGLQIGDYCRCHLEMCKAIVKGLSCVPNLKSLKIWGYLELDEHEAIDEYFNDATNLELFPKLENLESFGFQVATNYETFRWVEHMIHMYGRGIERNGLQKLAIDHQYWNKGTATNLKHLTEIHLLLDGFKKYDIQDVRNVLRLFPKGQLKKFCLSDYLSPRDTREIYINELIVMLAEFGVETVAFEKINLNEKSSEIDAVGITSLHLDDGLKLTFEFLKRLPDLRFLSVNISSEVLQWMRWPLYQTGFGFGVRQYFMDCDKDYKWKENGRIDIWKECAKLEMLSASVSDAGTSFHVQFVRESGDKPFWGWSGPKKYVQMKDGEDDPRMWRDA